MFDINFYIKAYDLKRQLMTGRRLERDELFARLEEFRSRDPIVYNIETTNACNMRCQMCPRTTMMTRPVVNLNMDLYAKLVNQIKPFGDQLWQEWESFVEGKYGIKKTDCSENHFFLYVIPRVVVLHGYGDPLLDKDMPKRVEMLKERAIPSYFSCNPANINIERATEIFANGLDFIKFSIEATDDTKHKKIRGQASNFTQSYNNIRRLLELKAKLRLKTTIVITMLNLNRPDQQDEFDRLKSFFKDQEAYVYLKSQDQQWYKDNQQKTESIHWTEFCQFPFSSMTVKSNGESACCVEDFNNQIILGDTANRALADIWNGDEYKKLRQDHFNLTRGIKCTEECDMSLIGSFCG